MNAKQNSGFSPDQWEVVLMNQHFTLKQLFILCSLLIAELGAMASHLPADHGYEPVFSPEDLEEFE